MIILPYLFYLNKVSVKNTRSHLSVFGWGEELNIKSPFGWDDRKVGGLNNWENTKYLIFHLFVFGWENGKIFCLVEK